jgi:hypothetical protein
LLTRSHRQEALCRAYVRAVAAQAGVICCEPEQDYGIDLCLRAVRRRDQRHADVGGQLDLQLKSTTRAVQGVDAIAYDLEVKSYDDLRAGGDNCPRILVVLVMPEEEADWLTQSAEELALRRCAYWVSLEGAGPTEATSTMRVHLPLANVFSVEAVQSLLAGLNQRRSP